MHIRKIKETDRPEITRLLTEHWGSPVVVSRGKEFQADELPGMIAEENNKIIGLLTYYILNTQCQIITLNAFQQNRGVGTLLLKKLFKKLRKIKIQMFYLITTNDNTDALRFYQKRNFQISNIYYGAMEESRKLKPSIPLIGNHGIQIKDEIELTLFI